LPRDALHKRDLCRRAVSVRLSVAFVYPAISDEMSKHILKHFSPSGTTSILVFFRTNHYSNGDGGCRLWQPVQADSQSKSSGSVLGRRALGAVLHSSNEPNELSQWLCHDDSTINIILDIIIIVIIIATGTTVTGASNAGGVGKNLRFSTNICLHRVFLTPRPPSVIIYIRTAAPDRDELVTFLAGKRRCLLFTGDDDEVFMTRSLNVTPKTTEQHLILYAVVVLMMQ